MEREPSALGYKFMSVGFWFRDLVRPRKNVLVEAGIRPGASVLDFGCGPGGYILPLAGLVGPSGRIYALDINPTAIKSVKSLAARRGLTNLETIISDGPTGLPDGSLDFVLLYDVLHHLGRPDDVLAELQRVLKPEGVLSMSDHHLRENDIINGITASGRFKLLKKGEKVYNFYRV
jgi:ubiquinone/menaquinone biosynthesis C-methylase UbiE